MNDWRRGYMVIGTALCISGALAQSDHLLILRTAFVASAGLQAIVVGSAQAAEPAAVGGPKVLAPNMGEPQELDPRASKRPLLTLGSVPDVAFAPLSLSSEHTANDSKSIPGPLSVLAVQHALLRLGYDPGPADRHMGPKTHAAIVAYEELMGWNPSGLVNQRLVDSLIASVAAIETPDLHFENNLGRGAAQEGASSPLAAEPMPADVDAAFQRTADCVPRTDGTLVLPRPAGIENPRGAFEVAIVAMFNAARDTSLFLVRFLSDSAPRENTSTPSRSPIHGRSVVRTDTE